MPIRTIIIPAAGKGTRLMPATKVTAKELLPVYDRVVIDFAIEEARGADAERIIVVISAAKTAIRTYLRPNLLQPGPEVVFVFQDQPLGLGHAVLCCKDAVLPGAVGVLLPDDIILRQNCLVEMADHYQSGHMIAAMQVGPDQVDQYGIFRPAGLPVDRCIPVLGMVEKPIPCKAPSTIAAVGRYILDPMIFEVLSHTPVGKGGEVQLTDAISIAAHALPLTAFQFSGIRHDCGNRDGLLAAAIARQALAVAEGGAADPRADRPTDRPADAPPAYSVATSGATRGMMRASDRIARPSEVTADGR